MEGQYLAISKHGIYAAVSTEHDIRISMATEGYLCMLNKAHFPVEIIKWCDYSLYTSDRDKINKHCPADFKISHANLAVTLGGYLWAVSIHKEYQHKICLEHKM